MPSVRKLKLGQHRTLQLDNDPKPNAEVHQGFVSEDVLEDSRVAVSRLT